MVGIIANDEGDDTILAKTGLWEVPLAHFTADEIVKAVNCHDELVGALKMMANKFSKQGLDDGYPKIYELAMKALTKAQEAN